MSIEQQNIVQNPLDNHRHTTDVNSLKESLRAYGERSEDKKQETTELKIEEVIHQLVSANLPVAEMEAMLAVLPLEKRLLIQNMILAEQRQQISLMSQEQYKQFLNAQFPSGAPTNLGEMALSMAKDTSELYGLAQQEIEKTDAGKSPSEIAQQQIKEDRAIATDAANRAKNNSENLAKNIAAAPNEISRLS